MDPSAGRIALITGAAGNLGAAVAGALAEEGYRLALTDLESLDSAVTDLPGIERPLTVECDITVEQSVQETVETVVSRFGRIDVVVNAAGGFRGGDPVHETPVETWDAMIALNARSVFLVSSTVVPHMLSCGSGRIINVGATAALRGSAGLGAYAASKSAVVRLTESMADELGPRGINVNCVLPTILDTPQNRAAMPDADTSHWIALESLADVVLFLASEAARDIHGAAITVGV